MINNFMNCCFIGHSTIYDMDIVKERLKHIVQELIQRGVTTFYNGGMGQFDALGARTVYDLKKTYGHIKNVLITPYPNVDEYAARLFDEIAVSAGMRGVQILLDPEDLKAYVQAEYADLTKDG